MPPGAPNFNDLDELERTLLSFNRSTRNYIAIMHLPAGKLDIALTHAK